MNRYFIPLCFSFLMFSMDAKAEWVSVEADYIFGPEKSEAEACKEAERRAKEKALKSLSGENISSEDYMVCSEMRDDTQCKLNRSTWSIIDGLIKGTRNKKTETVRDISGFNKCCVSLDVNVGVAEGSPDPSFDIQVKLNRSTFRHGELLKINLAPTQPMHINIFQYQPYEDNNKQVTRIFPNAFDKIQLFQKSGSIPTLRGSEKYKLVVGFPEGVKKRKDLVDEYLMVLGTSKALNFSSEYSLEEFNARLLEIPRNNRRVVRRSYNVVRTK